MINLLPLGGTIAAIAVVYAVFMGVLQYFLHSDTLSPLKSALFTIGGFGGLNLILGALFRVGWRWAWKKFPQLNRILYPDLNGSWSMTIYWTSETDSGKKKATAYIRQTFLKISMEVESEDSESETIVAMAKKDAESDRAMLFYSYVVHPHQREASETASYRGMATLKLSNNSDGELGGDYFTSANTRGRFELVRLTTSRTSTLR